MKTKNIFKTLALAMLMPTMLLTTACSSEDDVVNNTANTENTINKGYALPVTVNVTREGDAATRATYNESTKKLEFSADDKLFVEGKYATGSKSFAGALDYVSEGTFSGTIYAQDNTYSTYDALLTAASSVKATLLPKGYGGSTGCISIDDNSTPVEYDDDISFDVTKAFVASGTAKATGVEQLSLEQASTYSNGFALAPQCAILNFTISGLEAGAKDVTLSMHHSSDYTVTGSVTPTSGVATFAVGVPVGANIKDTENNLTVGSSNFTLPSSTTFVAGKIYNIARNAIPGALIGQFSVDDNKKVYFSKGNLQATTTNMGTSWTWAFAANQWDYIGGRSYEGSETQTGNNFINGNGTVSAANVTVDLFGWSTEENYFGIHNSRDESDYSGNFVDWGATMGTGWCTLSIAEWHYLFYTRTVNGGIGSGKSYTLGQSVNGKLGVVLYPDDYTGELYTTAQSNNWSAFESAGCVFLPAAGYRDWGTDVNVVTDVNDAGDDGYYWSSSANGDENANYVYFDSDYLEVDDYDTYRYCGHSVRLVRPVQ